MAGGMLSGLFTPQARDLRLEELDEDRRIAELANDPFKAAAMTAYGASRDAGRGLGSAVAAGAGKDPRSSGERHMAAVEAAKAEVAKLGLDPDNPETIDQFYKQVIMILQRQGLAAEALAVGKEYQEQKSKRQKDEIALRDVKRKEAKDVAADARSQERNAILAKKGLNQPETMQLLALLDQTPPEQAEKRKAITARLNALAAAGNKGVKFVDLGDVVQIVDAVTGELIREEDKGVAPLKAKDVAKAEDAQNAAGSAYAEHKAGLQQRYDAVVALYSHPGLDGITGRLGRLVGEDGAAGQTATTVSSADARAALALYKQVVGGTFLAGLAKLKEASKTGATGLGAVTEREGDKVQSDAAALDRAQDAGAFRTQLGTYAKELEGYGARLDAAAAQYKIPAKPLAQKPLQAPVRGRRPAPATPATPSPAPAAPSAAPAAPAGGWTDEKERRFQELKRKQQSGT